MSSRDVRLKTSDTHLTGYNVLPIVLNKALTFGETVKYSQYKVFSRHLTRESSRHCSKLQVNSRGMFIEVDCTFRCNYICIN